MNDIYKLVEEINASGNPENLNLSEQDFSNLDLGLDRIYALWEEQIHIDRNPIWVSRKTGGINLSKALLRYVTVRNSTLDHADFSYAQLSGAHLQETNFTSADFESAELVKTTFTNSILKNTNLINSDCEEVDFTGADLRYANLTGVNLLTARSLKNIRWSEAILDRTRLRREQLGEQIGDETHGDLEEARRAYLSLKNNFKSIGQYEDASWAYTKEREMERLTHKRRVARTYYAHEIDGILSGVKSKDWLSKLKFYVRHQAQYFLDTIYKVSCNYGESVGLIMLWTLAIIIGFAALYGVTSSVGSFGCPTNNWLDLFIFSLANSVSADVDGLETLNNAGKTLKAIEGVVGIAAFGLVMFVLGNRISRD